MAFPALALLLGAGFLLADYPYRPTLLAALVLAYMLALWRKPELWLALLPILIPVLDWAPWSGSLMLEEFDFFLVATLAVLYVRLAPQLSMPPKKFGAWLCAALGMMFLVSIAIHWPSDAHSAWWTADYLDPLNGWRVARGFIWAALLLPLIPATLARQPDALERYFLPGMVSALGCVSLIALWERLAFPGLLDFTSDYRITAGFSGMHVGGAGLDGFLALTFPLALGWTLSARGRLRLIIGLTILALASYAVLVTFSRGLYLGLAIAALLSAALWAKHASGPTRGRLIFLLLLGSGAAWACLHAFPLGGLRVLAMGLITLALSVLIACISRRILRGIWFVLGFALFALAAVIAVLGSGKGIYVLAGIAVAMGVAGVFPLADSDPRSAKLRAAIGALGVAGSAVCVLGVAYHHAGAQALLSASFIPVIAMVLILINRTVRPRLWETTRSTYLALLFGILGLGLTLPIAGNYYMKGRFAESDRDWQIRWRHWQSILDIMPSGVSADILGAGPGKLPEYYFWRNPKQDVPGSFQVRSEAGSDFVRLGAPRYAQGYGEALRYGQRIAPAGQGNMMLSLSARASAPQIALHIEICDKLLIYPRYPCLTQALTLPQAGVWQAFHIPLDASVLTRGRPIWRPVQFSLYNENAGSYIDVTEVALIDTTGENLIANGDFRHGEKRWFFSSDHRHLPWHAKDIWLHLYFEQGWLGIILFALLLAAAVTHLLRASPQLALARMLLAGIVGFLAVGLFDSLLDMPRVALLFFLSLAAALYMPLGVTQTAAPIKPVHNPVSDTARPRRRGRRGR